MLAPLRDYAAPPEQWHQGENCLPDWRNTAGTVVASPSDYQNFHRSADLPLAQPRLHAKARIRRGGQRLPQVERVLRSERSLVESSQNGMKGNSTSSHFAQPRRRILSLTLRGGAHGQSERRRYRDPPAFGSLHQHTLRNAARGCVLSRHRVAVGAVDHSRSDRNYAQISRDQRVRPR
jgi:hypothetical protein